MSNLDIWKRYEDIDPSFTKAISGKAYKGTSPNPHYVIKCLTEIFGPAGIGFGWEVLQEDFTPLGDEVLHWCRIRFWHTERQHYYDAYGQTKAVMKTRNGLMVDEDAPKKSLTDAIIKAASQVGIAANIFLGRWDDQKYVADLKEEYSREEATQKHPEAASKNYDARALYTALDESMRQNKTRSDLAAWWKDSECVEKREKLPADWQRNLYQEFSIYGKSLPSDHREAA